MKNRQRADRLGEESIAKLLFKFSVPAIIGMVVQALYNVVDRIFLGLVSNDAIAAVYVTFPITLLMMAVGMLFGTGGNALVSLKLGQNRLEDAERIISSIFAMLFLAILVLSVVAYIVLEPMLYFFGATENLMDLASSYMKIIIIGFPLMEISFGLNNFMRGEGNPMMAMLTMLIGAIMNIILDYVFIVNYGMGVEGAALATIIGQGCSFLWVMWHFTSKRSKSVLKLRLKLMKPEFKLLKKALSLGFPFFGMQVAASLVTVIFNHELGYFGGDLAIATMGILQSLSTGYLFPIFGLNQGVQPILGYNYGAENYARVKETIRLAIKIGTGYLICFTALVYLKTDTIIGIFVSNPEEYAKIHDMAYDAIRLAAWSIPIVAYPILGGVFFLAIGKAMISSILSISRQFLVLIPVVLVLAYFFGLPGIWLAYPVSDVITTLLTMFYLEREIKDLNHKIAYQPT